MSHRHLTIDDRHEIVTLIATGHSQLEIAEHLGKDQSSISREIARNRRSDQLYRAGYAQKQTKKRRVVAHQRFRKLGVDKSVTDYIVDKLECYWSPEQIVGRMERDHELFTVSHTAIYQYVYQMRPDLVQCLRFHHNRYRRRYGTRQREAARKLEEQKRSIDLRPAEVALRTGYGHWEGDTVVGTEKTSRILTHVERKSGYLLADKLDRGTAELTRITTETTFSIVPSKMCLSITYDNGVEFSEYETLERNLHTPIYFAHPYHSWERGTNENTNGLLRQFFPKRSAFATISIEHLTWAVESINQRPRKRLNYQTPEEVLTHAIRTLI